MATSSLVALAGSLALLLTPADTTQHGVQPLTWRLLTAGGSYTCGIALDGPAYCWGLNDVGQLGDGGTNDRFTPTTIGGDMSWVLLTAGGDHTCGLAADGRAYCWGGNEYSQLGNGSRMDAMLRRWFPATSDSRCSKRAVPILAGSAPRARPIAGVPTTPSCPRAQRRCWWGNATS